MYYEVFSPLRFSLSPTNAVPYNFICQNLTESLSPRFHLLSAALCGRDSNIYQTWNLFVCISRPLSPSGLGMGWVEAGGKTDWIVLIDGLWAEVMWSSCPIPPSRSTLNCVFQMRRLQEGGVFFSLAFWMASQLEFDVVYYFSTAKSFLGSSSWIWLFSPFCYIHTHLLYIRALHLSYYTYCLSVSGFLGKLVGSSDVWYTAELNKWWLFR